MDLTLFKAFGEALVIGLLVGIERYKDRDPGEKKQAGIRTFAEIALLGAVASLVGQVAVTAVIFATIAGFMALGYLRQSDEDLGLTTEIAALVTFWLGYMTRGHELLAVSSAIVLVIFLASKRALHGFVKGQVSDLEFYDTLKFLAVVFVVLPLLPDRAMGPFDFFNPRQVWLLVIAVSAIGYAGYVLARMMGPRRGLAVSAAAGGMVSTTAVTVSLAHRTRDSEGSPRGLGVIAVVANAIQFPRLAILLWLVAPALAWHLALPLGAMLLAGIAGAWLLQRGLPEEERGDDRFALQNPFSLGPALRFAVFVVGIFFLTRAVSAAFGEGGAFLASAVGGLASVSAVALSVADLVRTGQLGLDAASLAVFLALAANMAVKWLLAHLQGGRRFGLWLAGGFASMLAAGVVVAALGGRL